MIIKNDLCINYNLKSIFIPYLNSPKVNFQTSQLTLKLLSEIFIKKKNYILIVNLPSNLIQKIYFIHNKSTTLVKNNSANKN